MIIVSFIIFNIAAEYRYIKYLLAISIYSLIE